MNNPSHILLVDDDVELAGLLRDYLVRDGFAVNAVADGESGVSEALSGRYSIVVLDVMMPGIGGIEALRRIRAASTVPVLMLTARGDQAPLVIGPLKVMPAQRRVEWNDTPVELTSTEFNLLEALARNAGRPVSKAELSEQALGRPMLRFDRSIDVHLSSIRHKLGQLAGGRSCIQTVYRQGYQLIRE